MVQLRLASRFLSFSEGSVWKRIFSRLNSGRIFEEEISASSVRGKIPCYSLEAIVSEKSSREPGGEKEEEEYLFVYELFAGTVKLGRTSNNHFMCARSR